jgi:hypothetical protein
MIDIKGAARKKKEKGREKRANIEKEEEEAVPAM